MSSSNIRKRRNKWSRSYRLNRAALMRMEEGRRKVAEREEEYNSKAPICIELEASRNDATESNLDPTTEPSDNEEYYLSTSRVDTSLVDTETELVNMTRATRHRALRNKDRSNPQVAKTRLKSLDRSKMDFAKAKRVTPETFKRFVKSAGAGKSYPIETTTEHMITSSKVPPAFTQVAAKIKSTLLKKTKTPQTATTYSRPNFITSLAQASLTNVQEQSATNKHRSRGQVLPNSHRSNRSRTPSPDKKQSNFPTQTDKMKSRATNIAWSLFQNPPAVSQYPMNSSPGRVKAMSLEEYEVIARQTPLSPQTNNNHQTEDISVNISPTTSAVLSESLSASEHSQVPSSFVSSKQSYDDMKKPTESPIKKQLYDDLKSTTVTNLLAPSVTGGAQARTQGRKPSPNRKRPTSASKRKKSTLHKLAHKRYLFDPVTPPETDPDQNEVISRWRKRLGTSSLGSSTSPNISSSVLASSTVRDSQILRLQNESNPKKIKGQTTDSFSLSDIRDLQLTDLIPERDSPDISLDELELQTLLGQWSRQRYPANVLSPSEEEELYIGIEREKKKKQIRKLEEVAKMKLEQLDLIRRKKRKALEEEIMLNEKLERILSRIHELRESDSFARLLDKQTQVFSTKVPKSAPHMK